jgi:hypothetical protein
MSTTLTQSRRNDNHYNRDYAAAVKSAPVLIITGMHRSATSLAASLCQSGGLDIGEALLGPGAGNPLGHFEDKDFQEFHQQALVANGFSPDGFITQSKVPVPSALCEVGRALVAKRMMAGKAWGWKDPRTTLFLDFWQRELPDAGFLFLLRSPWEVVDSLYRRGVHPFLTTNPWSALAIWDNYNTAIRDFVARHPQRSLIVHATDVVECPNAMIEVINKRLGVPLSNPANLIHREMLVSTTNQREAYVRHFSPASVALYEELLAQAAISSAPSASVWPVAAAGLAESVSAVEQAFCDWAKTRGNERDLAVLQAANSDMESALKQVSADHAATEQQAGELAAALEAARAERFAAEQQAGELATALEAARAERFAAEQQAGELATALEAARAERFAAEQQAGELATALEAARAERFAAEQQAGELATALEAARAERFASAQQAAALQAAFETVCADRSAKALELHELRRHTAARLAALQAEIGRANSEANALRGQAVEAVTIHEDLTTINGSLRRELDTVTREYEMVLRSNSWRFTRPLRELRRWITRPRWQWRRYIAMLGARAAEVSDVAPADESLAKHSTNGTIDPDDVALRPLLASPASTALAYAAGVTPAAATTPMTAEDTCKLIAFYLPQFHAIPENDEWWGPGFTEWTNVARGRPNFAGHYQPHIPRELGFYDLTHPDVMRRQAELARLFGISGFCFYHYWFSGRRVLERPLEQFLASDIDLSFCVCWANENWTRTWDGDTKSVLLQQHYRLEDMDTFLVSLLPALRDRRYIRIRGRPLLLVYRAREIPSPAATFAAWRRLAEQHGLGGLHIAAVDFYDVSDPAEVGADSLVEFPPHKFNGPANVPDDIPQFTNRDFAGGILDYRKIIAQSIYKRPAPFTYFRGVIPSWDNTARRQNTPTTVINESPELYECWLDYIRAYTRRYARHEDERLIFVNAWNEWGEGCHLEPDVKWGLRFLESTFRSRFYDRSESFEAVTARMHGLLSAGLSAPSQGNGQHTPPTSLATESEANNGAYYKPISEWVHRVGYRLRRYPIVYGVARSIYRTSYRIRSCLP